MNVCVSLCVSLYIFLWVNCFAVYTQVAIVTGLGAAPWVVKPVYGFLSDTVPIFGYRRRSYLIICGLLGEHPLQQCLQCNNIPCSRSCNATTSPVAVLAMPQHCATGCTSVCQLYMTAFPPDALQ